MQPSDAIVSIATPARHLPMRIRLAARLGDDALFELCRINRDLRIERTKEGELVIMSPTGGETGRRNFALVVAFGAWAAKDGSGVGFDSSTGFVLPNGAERSPDVAWLKKERWNSLTPEQRRKFVPLCPDFVVELRSPSDELEDLQLKMQEYMDNGASLGWLVDAEQRRVYVYRAGVPTECFEDPEAVSGDPLLSGFSLSFSTIL
jgi:Uma2 family endonuclease